MPARHRVLALVLLLSLLIAGCRTADPTVTPVPVTATQVALVATSTPPPPTATPTQTLAPTETLRPSPTATPTPTSTATATPTSYRTPSPTPALTEAPVITLHPEPGIRADVRTYGGRHSDWASDVLILDDGGTLVVGRANNTHLSHQVMPGNARTFRTDADGDIVWQKDYGGEAHGRLYSAIQTGEDEFVIVGHISASDVRDDTDILLVKIDGEGNEIWSHTYGGQGLDAEGMVRQTADGGYIIAGDRGDAVPSGGLYQSDLVLIKTGPEGNKLWSRIYGKEKLYLAFGVAQTPDGGYVLTGWEAKTIPDRDVILIKTDGVGEVEWSRTWDLDPGERDGAFDMILTPDGHVVLACIQSMNQGPRRAVLIKVDLEGNEVWVKDYGEENAASEFWDIMEDADGGYVMAGAAITGRKPATGEEIRRPLVIKTDPDGEIVWQHEFDVTEFETASFSSAAVQPDGGYVFVGQATRSGEKYWDMLWLTLAPEEPDAQQPPDAPVQGAISVDTADQVERLSTLGGHSDKVIDLVFSGDGAHLASSSLDRTIKVWDVASWQEVHAFPMNNVGFNGIALSPDGRLLASADAIWDLHSKARIHELERNRSGPVPVAFTPDGSLLAVAVEGQPIKLWDVATGEVARTFADTLDEVTFRVVFSPDGTLLAASGHEGTVRLWDVESGEAAGTIQYGNRDVHDADFSPDGQALATGGTDETVRLWDVASGQELHTLRQGNGLYGVAFSPDGGLVASAGCDRTVKLWDAASGKLLRTLPHADEVLTVAFSPDATLLASGGYDDQIYLWGLPR